MKFRYLFVLLGILSLGLFTSGVQADGDVTVCDEAHLISALSGGGLVTFSCSGTISLSSPLSIDEDTVVDASGQNVTISAGGSFQVLYTNANITLRNLTIASGYGGPYTSGAGINNTGTLLLDRVTVRNNGAGSGGGIDNVGPLTIIDSTIRDNVSLSSGTGVGGNGAGIFNRGNANVLIKNTTFSSNYANTGGAIYNLSGTIDIVNSTFYENDALPGTGGAIFNSDGATVNVINSTFSRNEAGQNSDGSGIDNSGTGLVTVTNTIIANSQSGDNCLGAITDGGGNLSYPDDSCPGINLDPVLGSLQDNGGPTLTAALLNGSSAIDNAINSVCNNPPVNGLDQRGVARPIGEQCDIGAYESDAMPPQPDFVMNIDPAGTAMCLSESAVYNVDLLSIAGFDSFVTLSAINLPDGTDATFDNNPVTPPASSELTISNTGTASVGGYRVDVVGTSITRTQSISAYLYLYDTVPNIQPTLLTPADGATDVLWNPNFAWEPIPGAIYYTLQVATDIQFTNIVYSQTTLIPTDKPYNNLQVGTEHFWRVKARNSCGEGPFSEVSSFTTVGSTIPPTFVMDADPFSAWTCIPEDTMYDITLTGLSGFDSPVTLRTNGLPNGATATFDTNPVIPNAITELTISSPDPNSGGRYSVEIAASSSTVTKSLYVYLNLKPPAPDVGPNLLTPTDGMTDTVLTPTFSWEPYSSQLYTLWYTLEIATDSNFNNIVYSTVVLQTSHQKPTPLDGDTQYYWRVTASNQCGVGVPSTVYTFTTMSDGGTPPPPPAPEFSVFVPLYMMEPN